MDDAAVRASGFAKLTSIFSHDFRLISDHKVQEMDLYDLYWVLKFDLLQIKQQFLFIIVGFAH